MSGFQFTDDDDPQPQSPPQPPKPATPPGGQPQPPQPAKAGPQPPAPPRAPGSAPTAPVGGSTRSVPPPGPRPNPPAGGPQPGIGPRPPGPAGGPTPGIGPKPPGPGGGPQPGAGPKPPQRQAPRYGEGGVLSDGHAEPAHHPEPAGHDGPQHAPRDRTGDTLYEIGQSVKAVLDSLEPIATWVLRLAFLVGALCLAYMAVAYFGGVVKNIPNLKDKAQVAVITNNLVMSSRGLSIAIVAAFVASLILGYEDNKLGAIGAGIGAAMHFGVPLLLRPLFGPQLPVTAAMAAQFRSVGFIMLVIGLARATIDVVVWLVTLPDKVRARADVGFARPAEAKQLAIAREANMFSPCWKLPFCRETIRKQCPAFIAKKTCWKFGRGCYCDEEMIGRIIRGESAEAVKAPTRQSRSGKPPCGRCYIFLEHQTHKFRMLSPLALPATVVIMFVGWPAYQMIFKTFNKVLDSLWTGLSFNPQSLTPDSLKSADPNAINTANPYQVNPEQVQHFAMIFMAIFLGFLVLIYVSKFIEWAIYKAKL